MPSKTVLATAALAGLAHAWLPDVPKIRGVNLGGWLVSEPWMMSQSWKNMGCGSDETGDKQCSEFDCMSKVYGSDRATGNQKFQDHWANFIKPSDLDTIKGYGLNTIRIPVGYWIYRDIVDSSEPFPEGQLDYLDAMVKHAAELGLFVVMDLHGAPYAQKPGDAFTGQCASSAGFFDQAQYDRASKFLGWMANRIHTTPEIYNTTGVLEVVNEPLSDHDTGGQTDAEKSTLTQNFYPQALKAVRDAESALNVPADQALHVQFMDKQWQSGDPKSSLSDSTNVALDDHNYVKGALGSGKKQGDYMYYSCFTDNRQDSADGDSPKMVQEWSLTVNDENTPEFDINSQQYFYQSWFAAQTQLYEKTNGWIYWSFRNEFNDFRWSYELAVQNKIVPGDSAGLDALQSNGICKSWFPNN